MGASWTLASALEARTAASFEKEASLTRERGAKAGLSQARIDALVGELAAVRDANLHALWGTRWPEVIREMSPSMAAAHGVAPLPVKLRWPRFSELLKDSRAGRV